MARHYRSRFPRSVRHLMPWYVNALIDVAVIAFVSYLAFFAG
jgi:hypothetical protein